MLPSTCSLQRCQRNGGDYWQSDDQVSGAVHFRDLEALSYIPELTERQTQKEKTRNQECLHLTPNFIDVTYLTGLQTNVTCIFFLFDLNVIYTTGPHHQRRTHVWQDNMMHSVCTRSNWVTQDVPDGGCRCTCGRPRGRPGQTWQRWSAEARTRRSGWGPGSVGNRQATPARPEQTLRSLRERERWDRSEEHTSELQSR